MKKIYLYAMTFILTSNMSSTFADTLAESLREIAGATNAGLPLQIAADIQATSVTAIGHDILFRYHFTDTPPHTSEIDEIKKEFLAGSVNSSCTHPEIRVLISKGAFFKYEFYDTSNRFIFGYAVNEDVCNNMR